jgi:SWI/SNF-related matrix-associated actin-dependent regulator of chromatin subfamily A-like protein 1
MSKRQYYITSNAVFFKFDYNAEIVSDIKAITARSWNPKTKEWCCLLTTVTSSPIKKIIEKWGFEKTVFDRFNGMDDNLSLKEGESVSNRLKNYSSQISSLGLKYVPREYQPFAIDYVLTAKKAINGDDMGLGKTLETIFACEILNKWPVLIVCPSSVKYHWGNYFLSNNSKRTASVIDAKNKIQNFNADVVIINYDLLALKEIKEKVKIKDGEEVIEEEEIIYPRFPELISIDWSVLVIDEIHMMKSNKAMRTKIIKKIAKKVDYVWGLSGTLIPNRPSELIQPLTIIGVFNSLFGGWKNFVFRYCDAKRTQFGWDTSGATNLKELNQIMKDNCYFRREKREVDKDMPSIQQSILNIEISNKKEYDKAEGNFIDYIIDNFPKGEVESALMAEFLVLHNTLRQLSVAGKIKGIMKWLQEWKESTNEKLLIFGIHKAGLKELADHFKCKLIDGSVGAEEKYNMVKEFENSKDQFIFGNIMSMGTGTDGLQNNCSNVALIELPDNPSPVDQAISRVDRSGVKKNVNAYFLLSNETIDMDMWAAIESKRIVTEAVNKGVEVEERSFNDMLIKSFVKKYSE